MSEGIFVSKNVNPVFTFSGNGNWSDINNWANNLKPPAILPAGYTILVNPITGGQCILNVTQHISAGANILMQAGKELVLPGNLVIQ